MLTGFEALGAASAVLQVISFATDVVVACKNAYDGATTSQDDLQRYAGQMSEAVGRVHTRCEQMKNSNSRFTSPELQNIAKECKDAADQLETEVRDAIYFQQEASFSKLDTDVQFLIDQLAQGITDVKDLVSREHAATRSAVTQEGARAEAAINSHTDSQVLELKTTAETKRKSETFLQSLKATRMKQRYHEVLDSADASLNQVFATYEEIEGLYYGASSKNHHSEDDLNLGNYEYSEDYEHLADNKDSKDDHNPYAGDSEDTNHTGDDTEDVGSEGYESSEESHDPYMVNTKYIHRSWHSLNSWLNSDDKMFYIRGKAGSGKSTLVKFILNQDQTKDLIEEWSPDAIILSHFFWKIGSEEQNSIKGLWCSLLYQRLEYQQHLISSTLRHFSHLSLHSVYHDWSIKELQDVWDYVTNLDPRHMCVFLDGLDEIRNEDGFLKLAQTIQSISQNQNTKLCVSTRPETQIMRWLEMMNADGIVLEDLTAFDMHVYVREKLDQPLSSSPLSSRSLKDLRRKLVSKAEGVFLWLYLATNSILEGIDNEDSEELLSKRLQELPKGLENLYGDMWQRSNARSAVYRDKARRYFRYLILGADGEISIGSQGDWSFYSLPLLFQIACAEEPKIQKRLLTGTGRIGSAEIIRICNETRASIHTRCAGLLDVQPQESYPSDSEEHVCNFTAYLKASERVRFIHRTAHDFLIDKEAGQAILGCESLSRFPWQARLLKGIVCMVKVLVLELEMPCDLSDIVKEITNFANCWKREGLEVATEMLDAVQPLFGKHFADSDLYFWKPQRPFLNHLTNNELFDDYVISFLTNECPPYLATSILLNGWCPGYNVRLPKRTFDALIALEADAHVCGVLGHSHHSSLQLVPFIGQATAFTNFLVSFLMSRRKCLECQEHLEENTLGTNSPLEALEIALEMAKTCQNLNLAVALFAIFLEDGNMCIIPLRSWTQSLHDPMPQVSFAIFEVNIQLLLLYLISEVGDNVGQSVLASHQAEDILSRIDNPSAKVRYFMKSRAINDKIEQCSTAPFTLQRIEPQAPTMPRGEIEHLFGVGFDVQTKVLFNDDQTDLTTTTQYIERFEVEEVNIEDAMTSLAAENLGFGSCEELGITPSPSYMEWSRHFDTVSWNLFPLTMRRLEAAAAAIEESDGSTGIDD
ncbi:uncharacterized protein FSUBG_7915 [Fusarium subglutinans]|uniref:NACHT domain-containing protein n=1 Tax=Gibberella subglutinans TaxID=42677 RepID=A0A8H5PRI6_GIBSU|nr:uncharacterized protein FSUBG_7915 [Fusarium subglutinans]KAF5602080.1 hypothetical protein FSUBG_7915 [Fusarium subglutinans]